MKQHETITLKIDGVEIHATRGKRILEAALDAGIYIPNLCALRDIKLPFGACRVCQVQVEGRRDTVTACSEPAVDGMVVHNNTPEVNKLRRKILEILLARHQHACLTCWRKERCHPFDICLRNVSVTERCVTCPKNYRCDLQKAVDFVGLEGMPYPYTPKGFSVERDNPFIIRDNNLCILCGRCIRVDQEILGFEAIAFNQRGAQTYIGGSFGKPLIESGCTFCGACVEVCPVGALMDREDEWTRWIDRKAATIRCQYACPARVNVPRFIRFIMNKNHNAAVAVIRESVPLAAVCSLICEHPCESPGACRRGDLDASVAIRHLERFAVERSSESRTLQGSKTASSGRKVAVIGSDAAGLTAAYYLFKKGGHAVTVFESSTQLGGHMRTDIPDYVLPRKVLDDEIETLSKLGIEMRTGAKVESPAVLLGEGYDAVFIDVAGTPEGSEDAGLMAEIFQSADPTSADWSFIKSVAAGRKAATSIDRYLGGSGDITEALAPLTVGIPRIGRIENFAQRQRQKMPVQVPPEPVENYPYVELGFSDEMGHEEAKRCMGCDLRFSVSPLVANPTESAAQSSVLAQ